MVSHLTDNQLLVYHKLYISTNKRAIDIKINGMDTKYLYHVLRLLDECEQILLEHDLDLQRNREQLKSVRNGEWTLDQIVDYFERKEIVLEELYAKSDLPQEPNVKFIKKLFLECLEMHYGSLRDVVETKKDVDMLVNDINEVLKRYGR